MQKCKNITILEIQWPSLQNIMGYRITHKKRFFYCVILMMQGYKLLIFTRYNQLTLFCCLYQEPEEFCVYFGTDYLLNVYSVFTMSIYH